MAADAEATGCGYENRAQGGVVCTKVTVGLLLESQTNHKARGRDLTIHLADVWGGGRGGGGMSHGIEERPNNGYAEAWLICHVHQGTEIYEAAEILAQHLRKPVLGKHNLAICRN